MIGEALSGFRVGFVELVSGQTGPKNRGCVIGEEHHGLPEFFVKYRLRGESVQRMSFATGGGHEDQLPLVVGRVCNEEGSEGPTAYRAREYEVPITKVELEVFPFKEKIAHAIALGRI